MRDWLGPILSPFGTAGMVVVLVFFMLLDRENQRNRLLQLFGTSNLHATTEAMHDAGHRVGRYLRMQFFVNAGYGIAVGIGLWLIGVPGAVMWGVLGFSLRFLPYIGPWIAAALPILVSLGHSDGWTQPLLVVGWYIGLELIFNNVVEPLVYGSTTGVSTVGVILSAIFWTWLWGPIGLILAMPMTVCLVVAARYVPQLRFLTVLLADQPPMTPAERVYQRLLAFDYHEPLQLAHKHLKESSLVSFYDEVLIPALVLAEHDRHADLLNDDQEAFVAEAAEDLVEELQESQRRSSDAEADAERRHHATADGGEPHCRPRAVRSAARRGRRSGGPHAGATARGRRLSRRDWAAPNRSPAKLSTASPSWTSTSSSSRSCRRSRPATAGCCGSGSAVAIPICRSSSASGAAQSHRRRSRRRKTTPSSKVATTLAEAVALVRSIAAQQQLVAKTG